MGSHSLETGKEAPSITLSSESRIPSLDDKLAGKYVVLNFWSASDADSRLANRQLSRLAESLPSSKIQFVGVCTDSDSSLSNEIMKNDGCSLRGIYLDRSDLTPAVTDDYQTSSGCRTFLIDPFGNLCSISPSAEEIISIIS